MTTPRVPTIFDQNRRALRSARADLLAARADAAQWLIGEMEADLVERVQFMRLEPRRALILGPAQGKLASVLETGGTTVASIRSPDEEAPLPEGPFDLVTSLARLDTVNDLPGALLHARMALAEGGVFMASFVGAGSLPTLREILMHADAERPAARIHPQIDNRAATALLERAGFVRQVVDSHTLRLRYRSLDRLVADLREQALTNVLADPPPPLGKAGWQRALEAFDAMKDAEGRVTETFELLTLTGWR